MENNNEKIKFEFSEPIEKAKKLIGLKQSAYKDYLAARVLFLNDQLHQAAIFANTCIEKEIKACLYTFGVDCKKLHDSFKLLNLLYKYDAETFNKLNSTFIKVLSRIYESRYHESLHPGYNFVIVKRKFLAELDYTYSILEKKIRFKRVKSEREIPQSLYEISVLNKFPIVILDNYLYNDISKEDFLKKEDIVFEFRMVFNHEIMEASYIIPTNTDYLKFDYEGLTPTKENDQSHTISNLQPGITTMDVTRNGILQSIKVN